jgi:acyl-CoA thioesterase
MQDSGAFGAEQKGQLSAQQIAAQVGNLMWEHDSATQAQQMQLVTIGPGTATLRMKVLDHMVNGHGICHGGFIFLLADSAFAYSCNSFGQRAVAAGAAIDFLAAVHLGDQLTAIGRVVQQGKRAGVYDITVTNQLEQTVAVFRGRSATIKGNFLDSN